MGRPALPSISRAPSSNTFGPQANSAANSVSSPKDCNSSSIDLLEQYFSMSLTKPRAGTARTAGPKRRRDDTHDTTERAPKKLAIERPEQVTCDESIGVMDAAILADHLAKTLKRHLSDSTSLEIEDKYLPSKAIRDTSSFSKPRVAKHLPSFLETFSKGAKVELSSCDTVASPHTLVVTASGIRAADLTRQLRCFGTDDSKIAKLFAKHMKLKENIDFVQKTKIGIGVGTPSRLKDLLESGALKITALKRIIIDGSYIDEKRRNIFDIKEVYLPLIDMLNIEKLKPRLGGEDDATRLLVF